MVRRIHKYKSCDTDLRMVSLIWHQNHKQQKNRYVLHNQNFKTLCFNEQNQEIEKTIQDPRWWWARWRYTHFLPGSNWNYK